jgi:type IV pilus assembly protein PilQ
MNIKKYFHLSLVLILGLILSGCAQMQSQIKMKDKKPFNHNTPLIKTDMRTAKQSEISKTLEMGPKPVVGNMKRQKRKIISSETQTNYLLIPDSYPQLKQRITLKFKNLDFKETMILMGKIGEINMLVGDEVAGAISAELIDIPWDKALQALLDMKNYASDIDVASNLIRIHSPSVLTSQESYKSERAIAVKNKVEMENSVEPIISEIFRLYYISPELAKTTMEALFSSGDGEGSSSPIKITEESATRSIIVRGKKEDLDTVDKVLQEIDVKTEQVLIEAFIVKASSEFERQLGTRLGGYYSRNGEQVGGVLGDSQSAGTFDESSAALGGSKSQDMLTSLPAVGATSGIGVLKKTGSAVLKAEITALEKLGIVETISNPKVFTLNNQPASVTQGKEIPYEESGEGGASTTSFKEAALKLQVTPSIIGDGNVLLQIQVNNDDADTSQESPPITKMEIITKLLVADGDIVVIGGIKSENVTKGKEQVPGLGNVPVIGNLLKYKKDQDKLEELLIFIAPRILN